MGLRSVFKDAMVKMLEAAGEDALWQPFDGPAVPIKITIDFDVLLQPVGAEAQTWHQGTVITTARSYLGRVPRASPGGASGKDADFFEFEGVQYMVLEILKNDGIEVKVQVK